VGVSSFGNFPLLLGGGTWTTDRRGCFSLFFCFSPFLLPTADGPLIFSPLLSVHLVRIMTRIAKIAARKVISPSLFSLFPLSSLCVAKIETFSQLSSPTSGPEKLQSQTGRCLSPFFFFSFLSPPFSYLQEEYPTKLPTTLLSLLFLWLPSLCAGSCSRSEVCSPFPSFFPPSLPEAAEIGNALRAPGTLLFFLGFCLFSPV